MQKHHTKEKGDLGVLKAQLDIYEQGFMILSPSTEHAPFDLVGYRDGVFLRFQVKYRKSVKGVLHINFSTSWSDSNGVHTKDYDKNEIDYFCVYCPDTDSCYYVKPEQFGASVALRLEPPKNNQLVGVKLASEYRKI